MKEFGQQIVLGNCRTAYYISNSSKLSRTLVSNLLKRLNIGTDRIAEAGEKLQLPLSLGYDVLLSLLVPEPEVKDFHWNMKSARNGTSCHLRCSIRMRFLSFSHIFSILQHT